MIKRTDGELQAYVDGYNACFEKFRETLLQRNVGADKAIRKMETLKEAVNSVLLTENVGMCQQNVGEMSEKQTDGDLISRDNAIELVNYALAENKDVLEVLENMPSAEKTEKWISVSERLPEKNDIYVVWTSKGFGNHLSTSYYSIEDGWSIGVCAWKENVEQYKEESEK